MIHRDKLSTLGNVSKPFPHFSGSISKHESRSQSVSNPEIYVEMINPLNDKVGRTHIFHEKLSKSFVSPQNGSIKQIQDIQVRIFPDKIQSGDRVILCNNKMKNPKGKIVNKPEKPKQEQPPVFKKNWQHRKLTDKDNDVSNSNVQIHKPLHKQFTEASIVLPIMKYSMKYSPPIKQRDTSRSIGHENICEILASLSNKNSEECNSNQEEIIYETFNSNECNESEVFSPQITKASPTSTQRGGKSNTLLYLPIVPIHKKPLIPSLQRYNSNREEGYKQHKLSCNNIAKPKRPAPPIPILRSSSNREDIKPFHTGEIKRKY
ncbi:hypothetical protein LOD99_1663 [Oopsacas minuta]|uniref:Uncharacterized protein n=1 Tax=Oopsacas minuta TaxID=111878 RepID=A0AAV7K5C2_9METZ|nr:hypothetical protein LOD99_1663 [Oopsacas minuta]